MLRTVHKLDPNGQYVWSDPREISNAFHVRFLYVYLTSDSSHLIIRPNRTSRAITVVLTLCLLILQPSLRDRSHDVTFHFFYISYMEDLKQSGRCGRTKHQAVPQSRVLHRPQLITTCERKSKISKAYDSIRSDLRLAFMVLNLDEPRRLVKWRMSTSSSRACRNNHNLARVSPKDPVYVAYNVKVFHRHTLKYATQIRNSTEAMAEYDRTNLNQDSA